MTSFTKALLVTGLNDRTALSRREKAYLTVTGRTAIAAATLISAALLLIAIPVTTAHASSVFTSTGFVLPEGIVTAPAGGGYLVTDALNDTISRIPVTGGAPTNSQAMGFGVFGEVLLSGNYGVNSGSYLAYGYSGNSSGVFNAAVALVGGSGIAAPANVLFLATGNGSQEFTSATTAPTPYGSIGAGDIVLLDNSGGTSGSNLLVLNHGVNGTTTFATLPFRGFAAGFAPATFGGGLFVSSTASGNLYTVNAQGQASLFATLPLPSGFTSPGLRQFAWAPAGFGAYGGDLFVSIASQVNGGGNNGEIDVLNALGQTVALYDAGSSASPLDPRGLDFVDANTLLVVNADPGVTLVTPADFLPASQVLPEPGSLTLLLAGVFGLPWIRRRSKAAAA